MNDLTVNLTKTINAPAGKLFNAWLDPALLAQFILPMPGMPHPEVENDAQEGGSFSIIMQVGDGKIPHTGTYLSIKYPEELIFTWQSPFSVDDSRVSLMFKSIDANTTQVELTHVKFIDEETRSNHQGGWSNILDMLAKII